MEPLKTNLTKAGKMKKADVTRLKGNVSNNLRRLHAPDVERFVAALEGAVGEGKSRVRVYSGDGFVPREYGRSAPIEYVEAAIEGANVLITVAKTDGRRPQGRGNLTVIE